ncbi:hypothetical protein FDECE_16626 [Fusarium decemcellulare]|nr:hypothetical protein FDECE_16626 [Fusarium decemcellulare]
MIAPVPEVLGRIYRLENEILPILLLECGWALGISLPHFIPPPRMADTNRPARDQISVHTVLGGIWPALHDQEESLLMLGSGQDGKCPLVSFWKEAPDGHRRETSVLVVDWGKSVVYPLQKTPAAHSTAIAQPTGSFQAAVMIKRKLESVH